jgi:hypothetical protein
MQTVHAYLPEQEQRRLRLFSDVPVFSDGYKETYNSLESVLLFVQRHFANYIDISCMIPASFIMEAQDKVTESLQLIEQGLGKSGIDKKCKEIIMKPLYNLIATDVATHSVTREHLLYLEALNTELVELFNAYDDDEISQKLHKCLMYLNFNDVGYFTHVTDLMKNELNTYVTAKYKLMKLYEMEAYNNQLPVKEGIAYNLKGVFLKQQLKEWITDEIKLVKQRAEVEEAPALPADFAKLFDIKVFLDLSGDQTAYLVDLLYKVGIIKKKVVKARLMELASYFIATEREENLSGESLRKKMYNPGAAIVESVREVLRDLLNKTHSNILLLVPLTYLIIRMAQANASVTCLTLALFFSAHFTYLLPPLQNK